jgi:hypothetical protein
MIGQTTANRACKFNAMMSILVRLATFLWQLVGAEEAAPTPDYNGPSDPGSNLDGLTGGIDSWGVRPERGDPANDFMTKNGRGRFDTPPGVGVQVAAAQRAAYHLHQHF